MLCVQTIGELQHLIQLKLDSATLQVLCDASKLQDPETSNLQYTLSNDNISLCMWGNLSKNPRFVHLIHWAITAKPQGLQQLVYILGISKQNVMAF